MLEIKEKKLSDTWDNWCLRKLKELGRLTLRQWVEAMGYKNSGFMANMVKQFVKEGKVTVKKGKSSRLNIYEISNTVVFTKHYI